MGGLDTGALEQRARQDYRQHTLPSIAERFIGMGSGGQRSSAFEGTLASAGSDLETSLAGLRQGRLMQMLQMSLAPQFETMQTQPTQGFLSSMAPGIGLGLAPMLPGGIGSLGKGISSLGSGVSGLLQRLFSSQRA
jgi:hypothetical protein